MQSYSALVEKGVHCCTKSYRKIFHLFDINHKENLTRIVSYLCNWSKILATLFECDDNHFLPYFVFPFVKFYSNNTLTCFEVIATILINQCSLWFEFSPLLPSNYLGFIENLINYFEPMLMKFYRSKAITSKTFAWKLLRNGFSEVLVDYQWYKLWDHIVSTPSYFLIFAVVAFNCVQRHSIERLTSVIEIHNFFDEPSGINMNYWIQTVYKQMETCPIHLHPNQFMQTFKSIDEHDNYKKIVNYPRKQFQQNSQQIKQIQHQMNKVNQKYMDLEIIETNLMQQMVNNVQLNEHNQRLQQVKLAHKINYMQCIKQMEKQRQHLILSERQLNNREFLMKMLIEENQMQHNDKKREINAQNKLCDLTKQVKFQVKSYKINI